jgi:rare lipoprotein A
MKKCILILLGSLLCGLPVLAQSRSTFSQRGGATQELKSSGLTAAHPSLPIGSKVTITNTSNEKEIEATITGRIPSSSSRIVDLSAEAAKELDFKEGETVLISTGKPSRPETPPPEPPKEEPKPEEPKPEPVVELAEAPEPPKPQPAPVVEPSKPAPAAPKPVEPPPAEPKTEAVKPVVQEEPKAPSPAPEQALPQSLTILVNNYLGKQEEPVQSSVTSPPVTPPPQTPPASVPQAVAKSGSDTEFLAWLTAMTMDARESRESREYREARESREYREAREARGSVPAPTPPQIVSAAPVYQPVPVPAAPVYQPPAPVSQPAPVIVQPQIIQAAPAAPVYQPAQAGDVQIIPGIPDPNSGRLYRLQVGAYSGQDAAVRAAQQIQAAGFNAALEQAGAVYRALAMDIPAASVYAAASRLGSAGFRQIWVRE